MTKRVLISIDELSELCSCDDPLKVMTGELHGKAMLWFCEQPHAYKILFWRFWKKVSTVSEMQLKLRKDSKHRN